MPGSPSTSSFRFDSPKIDGAGGQPETVGNFREESVSGPPHSESRLNTGTTRWGCWSALTNPPKFQSGTLILGLDPETQRVVEQSGSDAPCNSHSVPRAGSDDVRLRFVPSVPHFAETATRRLCSPPVEAIAQSTGRLPPPTSASTEFTSARVKGMSQADRARLPSVASCVQTIQLRKDPHDKPRRLFILPNRGVLSITMRGCFDIVPKADYRCVIKLSFTPYYLTAHRNPAVLRGGAIAEASSHIVDDACIISGPSRPTFVLGQPRNNQQLSLVRLKATRVRAICSHSKPS